MKKPKIFEVVGAKKAAEQNADLILKKIDEFEKSMDTAVNAMITKQLDQKLQNLTNRINHIEETLSSEASLEQTLNTLQERITKLENE